MEEEAFLRIKIRYSVSMFGILAIFFLPVAIAVGQFSATGAVIVMAIALVLGWLLELGTPPVYEIIIMLITTLVPVGFPMYNLRIDGITGEVGLNSPFIKSEGGQ